MKKLLSIFCLLSAFAVSSFADTFFSSRFFEVTANVPVEVSNNTISLDQIFDVNHLFKEAIVIDLADINNRMPSSGFNVSVNTQPKAGFRLDIPKGLIFGANAGVDFTLKSLFSKDIFDFLTTGGYSPGDVVTMEAKTLDTDVFTYLEAEIGWNTRKSTLVIKPAAFIPVVHASPKSVKGYFQNTEDGKFIANANVEMEVYSNIELSSGTNSESGTGSESASANPFGSDFNFSEVSSTSLKNMGFDVGASYSLDLFSFLTVGADIQIPLVPGKLTKRNTFTYSASFEADPGSYLSTLTSSSESSESGSSESGSSSEGSGSSSEGESSESSESESKMFTTTQTKPTFSDPEDVVYNINRPLKFSVNANFHPFGDFLCAYGRLGFNARHAFDSSFANITPETFTNYFYIDYLIGGELSLLDMIRLNISTERTNQIFAHKAAVAFSLRFVEAEVGIALESSNFFTSFAATGVGAFVNVAVGI